MKIWKVIVLGSIVHGLSGCDTAVRNFVRNENPPPVAGREPQAEAPKSQGPMQLSVSSGGGQISGGGLTMRARVAPTERQVQMGSDRKAVLSVGRTRIAF